MDNLFCFVHRKSLTITLSNNVGIRNNLRESGIPLHIYLDLECGFDRVPYKPIYKIGYLGMKGYII